MCIRDSFAAILCVLCWRLGKVGFLTPSTSPLAFGAVAVWFAFQTWGIIRTNRDLILGNKVYPKEDRYEFRQVAILELTYIVNFGSELAVVSMLPTFFETTFDLPKATAGILASCFAFVNLVAPVSYTHLTLPTIYYV